LSLFSWLVLQPVSSANGKYSGKAHLFLLAVQHP
jgi:hypothetical protein